MEATAQQFDVKEVLDTMKELKAENDKLKKQMEAEKQLKKMEQEAREKAEKDVQKELEEVNAFKSYFDELYNQFRQEAREKAKQTIEFPVTLREGNLSKSDKALVDLIMGKKEMTINNVKTTLTTSGLGGNNLTNAELASEIIRYKNDMVQLRNALRVVNMPSNPFKMPLRTGPADVTAPGEAAAIAEQTNTIFANTTLTAYKIAANVPVSTEEGEDSVIAVLPEIKAAIAEGLAKAEEEFWINATINNGMAVSGAGSGIAGAAGGNQNASDAGSTGSTLSDFEAAFFKARQAMGVYGIDPSELVFVVGYNTYLQLLLSKDNTNFMTREKYGDQAIVVTGELGRYYGVPVLVSSGIRYIADGDANQTSAEKNLLINKRSVLLGDRRTLTLKSAEYIDSDILKVVGTIRIAYSVPTALNKGVQGVTARFV